jgi:hypothetical protein
MKVDHMDLVYNRHERYEKLIQIFGQEAYREKIAWKTSG